MILILTSSMQIDSSGTAVLYNADHSLDDRQILFAANPRAWPLSIKAESVLKIEYLKIGDE